MPVPRLRLWYVTGLYEVQPELRRPQDIVCTTDGDNLVICPTDSYRPLVTIPLEDIKAATVKSPEEAGIAGIHAEEAKVLVVETKGGDGVPEGPIVIGGARATDVTPRVEAFKELLKPRTAEEMAQLRAGDRRLSRIWAVSLLAGAALVIFLLYAVTTCLDEPEEESAPKPPALIVLAAPSPR